MEGTESEAVFESLNLNPSLFVNEVLNSVDDLVDGAFEFYKQQASSLLTIEDSDRSDDLNKGIAYIRSMIQGVLDKRLAMWEKYCLRHCFIVPEGFSFSHPDSSLGMSQIDNAALDDSELDVHLNSLRNKLTMVTKESAELNRELQALEKQVVLSNHHAGSFNEMLQLYEQNSAHGMFKEVMESASELQRKIEKLKRRRMEEDGNIRRKRILDPRVDLPMINCSKGLFRLNLEDLEEFVADMENT